MVKFSVFCSNLQKKSKLFVEIYQFKFKIWSVLGQNCLKKQFFRQNSSVIGLILSNFQLLRSKSFKTVKFYIKTERKSQFFVKIGQFIVKNILKNQIFSNSDECLRRSFHFQRINSISDDISLLFPRFSRKTVNAPRPAGFGASVLGVQPRRLYRQTQKCVRKSLRLGKTSPLDRSNLRLQVFNTDISTTKINF